MSIIAFLLGITLPALTGIMTLAIVEGHTPVLLRAERIALGTLLGITGTMFLTFIVEMITHLPLALPLYGAIQIICLLVSGSVAWKKKLWTSITRATPKGEAAPLPAWVRIGTGLLLLVMIAKIALTSVTFLLLSPSYLDDSLTNWNLRGEVFYYDHALTLVLPNEDPVLSPKGVSSYPPAVPLSKAWLASIAGRWSDPLVNSIHVVWYLCALTLVFCAIRRQLGTRWATLGLLMIGGMPLYLLHGTNAYADVFLSAHVFAAVSMLFAAGRSTNEKETAIFLRLAAICTAILPFTKNEAMLVFLPPLLLLTLWTLWSVQKKVSMSVLRSAILWYIIPFLCVAGPWLFYKWSQGLTFGNGKAFTSLGIGWHQNVLQAIGINTFFEGNWLLLLPLLFLLLVWRFRHAFTTYVVLSVFFLAIYIGQVLIYLFTDLATEALRQTGYARGLVQLTPVMIFLTVLLLSDAFPLFFDALAKRRKIVTE